MTAWGSPVPRSHALLTAFVLALLLGWRTTVHEYEAGGTGGDFGQFRRGSLALLDGQNPYHRDSVPPYPLPSFLVIAPLSPLPAPVGAGVFTGLGALALVYGLLRRFGWQGLVMLASPAFFLGWFYLQWSPLIVAGALLPWLGGLGVTKPNVGVAPFWYRPSWQWCIGAVTLLGLSWILVPTWVTDWRAILPRQGTPHTPPLLWPVGAIGLVGALRWRRPGGRVLLAMTLTPLNPQFYDHLGVWLSASTWRESLILSACGWLGFLTFLGTAPHNLTVDATPAQLSLTLAVYLPAAFMVLRHPNSGTARVADDTLTISPPKHDVPRISTADLDADS